MAHGCEIFVSAIMLKHRVSQTEVCGTFAFFYVVTHLINELDHCY